MGYFNAHDPAVVLVENKCPHCGAHPTVAAVGNEPARPGPNWQNHLDDCARKAGQKVPEDPVKAAKQRMRDRQAARQAGDGSQGRPQKGKPRAPEDYSYGVPGRKFTEAAGPRLVDVMLRDKGLGYRGRNTVEQHIKSRAVKVNGEAVESLDHVLSPGKHEITVGRNRRSTVTVSEAVNEGHGAIQYNYYYGQNSNGLHSQEAAKTGSGEQQAPRGREDEMNWADKQQADILHMRNGPRHNEESKRQVFQTGQQVEAQTKIALPEGVLPAFAKGRITKIDEGGIHTVDFGQHGGEQRFAHEVISAYFAPIKRDTMRESIRSALKSPPKINEHPEAGDRVVDKGGNQLYVERRDPMGTVVQVKDIYGRQHRLRGDQIRKIDDATEFAPTPQGHNLTEGLQSVPLNPGQRVTVTSVDPIYNQWRSHAVPANEVAGYIGQTGMVEFASYPVSSNTRMYTVLFDKGGRREFSEAELANPEG